ncbi:hypothetical protein BBJ28_00007653, partial [Nothophytophthora sp. Chile5]
MATIHGVDASTSPESHAAYHEPASAHVDVLPRSDATLKGQKEGTAQALAGSRGETTLKKFLCWRMSKKQRVFVIVALVLLLLLVLFLIVWFAIIPAMIRHYTKSIEVSLNYMDVVNISDASTMSVELSLRLQHDMGVAASSDATTASLLFNGSEFATLVFPALQLARGKQDYDLNIYSDMEITDESAFNAMAKTVMTSASITLETSASLDAHALGMAFNGIKFSHELTVDGFAGFSDPAPEIKSIHLKSCSSAQDLIDVDVTLNNTARMGLDGIGALNMSLYLDQTYLGYAISQKPELGIPRGVSDQIFQVTMDPTAVSLSSVVVEIVAGKAQFFIVGDNPYATTHSQFMEALQSVNMSV